MLIKFSVCRQVFDFTLEAEEMKNVTALNRGWRYIVPMIEVSELFFVSLCGVLNFVSI